MASLHLKLNKIYVPKNEELIAIRRFLVEPDKKLRALHKRISTLRTAYEKLMQERSELKRQIDAHEALLAPMRRIPDEVLEEIFHHCLPKDRNPAMSCKEAPILLGRVCSRWRNISLTSSRLWAALHIVIVYPIDTGRPNHPHHRSEKIQAVREWLSRSGNHPLSISLFTSDDSRLSLPDVVFQPYLDILLSAVNRWKHIRLPIPKMPSGWITSLSRIRASDVPLLEQLHIVELRRRGVSYSLIQSFMTRSNVMRGPRLRSISLPGTFGIPVHKISIRWEGLVELNLSALRMSTLTICQALSSCPELQYCQLELPSDATDTTNLPHVSLPKLIGLAIVGGNLTHMSHLLKTMSAPQIRHLSCDILSPTWGDTRTHDILLASIRRTIRRIEELNFSTCRLSVEDVISVLSGLPGLKRLRVYDVIQHTNPYRLVFDDRLLQRFIPGNQNVISEQFIEMDVANNGGDCLCPHLEILHCTMASFSGSTFIEFLRSRSSFSAMPTSSCVVPLKEVNVTFAPGYEPSKRTKRGIDKLAAKTGMVVKLAPTPPPPSPPPSKPVASDAYSGISRSMALGLWTSESNVTYFGF